MNKNDMFFLHRMKFVLTGRLTNIIHVISPKYINKSTVFTSITTTELNEPFNIFGLFACYPFHNKQIYKTPVWDLKTKISEGKRSRL